MLKHPFGKKPILGKVYSTLFPSYAPAKPAMPAPKAEIEKVQELMQAIERNDSYTVDFLLQSGVNPQCMTRDKRLPLIEAVQRGHFTIASLLTDAGADPRTMDNIGRTAYGVVWRESYGGQTMDPTVAPEYSGPAYSLFVKWMNNFGLLEKDKIFSQRYQHSHLDAQTTTILSRDTQVFQQPIPGIMPDHPLGLNEQPATPSDPLLQHPNAMNRRG